MCLYAKACYEEEHCNHCGNFYSENISTVSNCIIHFFQYKNDIRIEKNISRLGTVHEARKIIILEVC